MSMRQWEQSTIQNKPKNKKFREPALLFYVVTPWSSATHPFQRDNFFSKAATLSIHFGNADKKGLRAVAEITYYFLSLKSLFFHIWHVNI